MLVDSHMHTPLCGHATGELIEYVRRAAELGIKVITITCHIPMRSQLFGQAGIRMSPDQLEAYIDLVDRTAVEARSIGVEVLRGIEAEVFPDEAELTDMDAILSSYKFDFVLGSLHAQCQSYLEWLERNRVRSDRMRIDSYFRHLRDGVESGRYNSMSHPDVIRTYGVVRSFDPREHETVIRDFLQAVVDEDICMEVNTSGLTKGAYEVHPDPQILDWASEMGVRLTIGSDAHQPQAVGRYFTEVQTMLRSKGFEHLHYFRARERIQIPLQ